jgi:hypothetical protein
MLQSSFVPHRPDATGDADGGAGAVEAIPPQSDPAQESKAPQPQSNADAAQDPGKTAFTPDQQAQIDELVAERVKRAEKSARQAALKEAETERQRAEMDELERVKAEKEESDRRAEEAQADRDRVLIDAEAKFAVLAAGVSPERLTRALRLLDLDGIQVEDGRIDTASVRRAVQTLKTEIPELFAVPGPARSGGDFTVAGEGKRSFTAAEVKAMTAAEYSEKREEIMAAMREGRYGE